MPGKVLVLEFNELSPTLIDRFIDAGDLPNFKRLRDSSETWTTDAGERDGKRLNPWVQWVTVHTGLTADEHAAFLLGEPVVVPGPTIADQVCASGGDALVFGSMNQPEPGSEFRGVWLPDPWSTASEARPSELRPYDAFVRSQVQEHTNPQHTAGPLGAAGFVGFLTRHGLRASTAAMVVRQLVGERLGRRGRWRRAIVLDRIQWDVFGHYFRRNSPTFATFFSNSTAHLQHLYWRDMDPSGFDPWEREGVEGLAGAVLAGYQAMDHLVGEALQLAGAGGAVVLCTALSQRANLSGEMLDRECFHRPRSFDDLVEALDLRDVRSVAPVMAEEFHVYFDDVAGASIAAATLAGATVDGQNAFAVRCVGDDVFAGCRIFTPVPATARLRTADGREHAFHELLYQADAPRSGTHHPDGLLWIHRPGQVGRSDRGRLPLTEVSGRLCELALLPSGTAQ